MRFCPGTYFLSVNVEDPLLGKYHAFARNLESFAVVDGQQCGGICFIEPSVRVRQQEGGPPATAAVSAAACRSGERSAV